MALTNDEELAWRMATLRSHGITRETSRMHHPSPAPWYYEQLDLGHNYRMTDLQAALGLSQLERLDEWVRRRRALAARYAELLSGLPLALPTVLPGNASSFHLYVVRVRTNAASTSHREVFDALRNTGIGVNLHYLPVHLQPYYRNLGFTPGMYPEAEAYAQQAITLPLYPGLTEAQQDTVAGALREILA